MHFLLRCGIILASCCGSGRHLVLIFRRPCGCLRSSRMLLRPFGTHSACSRVKFLMAASCQQPVSSTTNDDQLSFGLPETSLLSDIFGTKLELMASLPVVSALSVLRTTGATADVDFESAITADQSSFRLFRTRVFTATFETKLDHDELAVGFLFSCSQQHVRDDACSWPLGPSLFPASRSLRVPD